MKELTSVLQSLIAAATDLWQEYLDKGPGGLPIAAITPFESARRRFEETLSRRPRVGQMAKLTDRGIEQIRSELDVLQDLLRRCVQRTEGLSFITGEAGLIPRRDLHGRLEQALVKLRSMSAQLSDHQQP